MLGELMNHLWQSTVFAVAAALLTLAFRRNRAEVRYWLWMSASLKFLLPFSILISLGHSVGWAPAARIVPAATAISVSVAQVSTPFAESVRSSPALPDTRDWAKTGFL